MWPRIPGWPDDYRELALSNGIRAAWSEPILTKDNEVLGTFAVYSHEARVPSEEDLALIKGAGHIALIAIERQRAQAKLRQDEEELRRIVDLIPQKIIVLNKDGKVIYANRVALGRAHPMGAMLRANDEDIATQAELLRNSQRVALEHNTQAIPESKRAAQSRVLTLIFGEDSANGTLRHMAVLPIINLSTLECGGGRRGSNPRPLP